MATRAPPGWLHAFIMQYQVLPSFMFGFLLTVAHRLFPFSAAGVGPGCKPWRSMWLLAIFWPLSLLH